MIDPLASRALALGLGLLLLVAAWHKVAARNAVRCSTRRLPAAAGQPRASGRVAAARRRGHAGGAVAGWNRARLRCAGHHRRCWAPTLRQWRSTCAWVAGTSVAAAVSGAVHPDATNRLSWWLVVRNLLLVVAAALAALPSSSRALGAYDWLTLVLALVALATLYSGASQLLRNGAAIAAWRKPRD